jgi:preprotein translocase subunit SecA
MRLFGSDRIAGLMTRMGVEEGEVIEHGLVTRAISRAQKRVEAHNFDIRKHLLEYDNVMNEQRTVIYELRNQALTSEDISAAVLESVEEAVRERAGKTTGGGQAHRAEWNLRALVDDLSFLLMTPVQPADVETDRAELLAERAAAVGERAYRAREAEFGSVMMRELERHLYLYTVDEHWRDHLYELDHLKGGIGLRAYGQRDPLIEYKREAYTLFEVLVHDVREDFVQRLFRVQLSPEAGQAVPQPRAPRMMQTQHAEAQAFGSAGGVVGGPEPGGRAAGRPADGGMLPAPRVRTAPVVGRNDPCPCGSGKKYKKCHMLSDQGLEPRP